MLQAYVVHLGDTAGLNLNESVHYVTCVVNKNQWTLIDDDNIRILSQNDEYKYRQQMYYCLYVTQLKAPETTTKITAPTENLSAVARKSSRPSKTSNSNDE